MPKKLKASDRLKQYNEAFLKRVNALLDGADMEYCMECNSPLCQCGEPNLDGTPSTDCLVCKVRAQRDELRKQARCVSQVVNDFHADSVKYPQLQLSNYHQRQLASIMKAVEKLMKL